MDVAYRQPTSLEELASGVNLSLADGLLPQRLFNDDEVHRAELERIFTRGWAFVAHESEIPSNGDYVLRYIGEDPFIVVRDEHGQVRVLFDSCRHRGTQLCKAEKGNTSHFRCPYHGWTYKNSGELISAPSFRVAYSGMDKADWGLIPAPQVKSLYGLVFASLDPHAPPLDSYLGGMRWYLDLILGLNAEGMEVIGEPNRWMLDANWKTGTENFSGDDYHLVQLHKSMFEIGAFDFPVAANVPGYHVQVAPGHSASLAIAEDGDDGAGFWGLPPEVTRTFGTDCITSEQLKLAERLRVFVGVVFPNISFFCMPLTADPRTQEPVGVLFLRQLQPRGPGRAEFWNWVMAYKATPDNIRDVIRRAANGMFGPAGMVEQDDGEIWRSIARTGRSAFARTRSIGLNYKMGMDGVGTARRVDDWAGPGVCYWPRYEEGPQRNFYRLWAHLMTTPAGPWTLPDPGAHDD
jgi:phenylpropionate dioxygenase-like ring-hydroxylating dioxygenase large terminal subunit